MIAREIIGYCAMLVAIIALPWAIVADLDAKRSRAELRSVRGELSQARDDLATCRTNRIALSASLERQNAAVASLSAEAQEAAQRGAEALSLARRDADVQRRRADTLLASQPRPGETGCEAADRLILEAVQ